MSNTEQPVLRVRDLRTEINTREGVVTPVDGVSFELHRGEILGIVGESGSGKSMTCLSIMRLLPGRHVRITDGEIWLGDTDLTHLSDRQMREIRGSRIAMILQEPLTSLDPVYTIGEQLAEPIRQHQHASRGKVREIALNALRAVHIPAPEARLRSYPHQMSGGMRQRVVTAMALSCEPDVLIADEPTTALDVTIQAQVLRLFDEIRRGGRVGMLLITHDFGIVAQVCQRVAVMYAGRVVETGPVEEIFDNPKHPYTAALIASVPKLGPDVSRLVAIEGQPPSLAERPAGCPFAPRGPRVLDRCREEDPPEEGPAGHRYRCWNPGGIE
jgi:oligopeptide/dipeptide ABC transporter ATP-binding protein